MASNDYVFITKWSFEATCEQVFSVLNDPTELTRWWPEVYLDVSRLTPPDEPGCGAEYLLHTKGFLPYTLKWSFVVTEVTPPHRIALAASGDFDGQGVWTFTQNGDTVDAVYDWRIRAEKPILRRLSFLLKPIFSANHKWAMRKGEAGLARELCRRSAAKVAA